MDEVLNKFLGTYTSSKSKEFKNLVLRVNELGTKMKSLKDSDFVLMTQKLRNDLLNNRNREDVIVESLALCREAIRRKLNMYPYDVQIEASLGMQDYSIAEMKTGEGKTLVQILSAYINSLEDGNVHVVTANEYLAARDFEENKSVFELLGLSVGLVRNNDSKDSKRNAYSKDIVYSTIRNISFDYLRDNNVRRYEDKVISRPFSYIVIDEIDSTLLDEATTPIILSALKKDEEADTSLDKLYNDIYENIYTKYTGYVVDSLVTPEDATLIFEQNHDYDYIYCKENNRIYLSDKLLFDKHHKEIEECLYARWYYENNKKYVLKDKLDSNNKVKTNKEGKVLKEIVIIDESTGRLAKGKKYSDGYQNAIEAKEKYLAKVNHANYDVSLGSGIETLGICTYFDILGKYKRGISGMTGTSSEDMQMYGLHTYKVPTRKRSLRTDSDKTYITKKEKYEAILKDVKACYRIGRPVLIGTTSVYESNLISKMLNENGILHNLLNAENESLEASIIENAGQFGSVTVSTNMAGRGTDIKLGEGVRELGGLHVIGASRNKSSRIDNQLRGRAGRQGDVGSSMFYCSLEDDIVTAYAGKLELLKSVKQKDFERKEKISGKEIEDKSFEIDIIEKAQKKQELIVRERIKNIALYKSVLFEQREEIYGFRDEVLKSKNIIDIIKKIISNNAEYKNDLSIIIENSKLPSFNSKMQNIMIDIIDEYWHSEISYLDWLITPSNNESITSDVIVHYEQRSHELYDNMRKAIIDEIIFYAKNPNNRYGSYIPNSSMFKSKLDEGVVL